MKKVGIVWLALLAVAVVFFGCNRSSSGTANNITLSGTYILEGTDGYYTFTGNKVTSSYLSKTRDYYTYEIKKGYIKIIGSDGKVMIKRRIEIAENKLIFTYKEGKVTFIKSLGNDIKELGSAISQKVEDTFIDENIQYNDVSDFNVMRTDDGKSVIIKQYIGTSKDVNIPPTIRQLPVTIIDQEAFTNKQLTSVTIPNSVTTIGFKAFYKNQLTSLTIGNKVTSIKESAFAENKLTSITIPNSVTSIEKMAFVKNQLSNIIIGTSVTFIGDSAFAENKLTSVTIPNSVTTIEDEAFRENQLSSVSIGNSVTAIEYKTFYNNRLTNVIIPNSVTTIGNDAFGENQLTSVTIGKSVKTIGEGAFQDNKLTNITIPNGVEWIKSGAFYNNQITSIIFPRSVSSIGYYAFSGNNLTKITIGSNVNVGLDGIPNNFDSFYGYGNGKKAGTYIFNNGTWSEDW